MHTQKKNQNLFKKTVKIEFRGCLLQYMFAKLIQKKSNNGDKHGECFKRKRFRIYCSSHEYEGAIISIPNGTLIENEQKLIIILYTPDV